MLARLSSITTPHKLFPLFLMLGGAALLVVSIVADLIGASAPGLSPSQISLALSGLALLLAGVVLVGSLNWRRLAEWLLVGAGAVAAAFAADLLVIGGLPSMAWKQLAVLSVVLGAVVIGVLPAATAGQRGLRLLPDLRELDRAEALRFLVIVAQLALLVLLIRQFELESQAFHVNVMALTFYGFLIHFFLPLHYRLPFFLFLSFAAIFGVLGFSNGLWLVGVGLVLILLTRLPLRLSLRIALLLGVGMLLVLARVELLPVPWPSTIWPVLGSIFMFRLIIYLYDLHHAKKPVNGWETLSYFFLLPNVVFPFFPLVDFAAFRRTYFNEERYRIYQRGLQWMLRGAFQLLVYRFANYYLVIAMEEVTNAWELAQYTITNFGLYLRVSGQFHLIIGLLHLFGFNLPETNHRYFLASSFTDLWRRINIYWKDFMQKIFYYPSYVRLSRLSTTGRLLAALVVVFFMSWFLRAYQWFWLRGTFLFTVPDIVFWIILAVFVMATTLWEVRRGRKRSLSQKSLTFRELAWLSLRTAAVMSILMSFWSLWTSPTVGDWLALWGKAASLEGIAILAAVYLGMAVVIGVAIVLTGDAGRPTRSADAGSNRAFFQAAASNAGAMVLLLLLSLPAVYNLFGERVASVAADMRSARLGDRDAQLLLRGYYEEVIGVDRFNPGLWDLYSKRPSDWPRIQDTELAQLTGDFMAVELVPNQSITFHGALFSTNSWGIRDQEYSLTPAAGTYRIALLGPSFVMGSGVADDQVFEALLEERLNTQHTGGEITQYEILNLGMAGFSALQEVYQLETEALQYQPSAVFYVAHQLEEEIIARNLATFIVNGVEVPYPELLELATEAGVRPDMGQPEAESLLRPHSRAILSWLYQHMATLAEEQGIEVVWVFLPALETAYDPVYAASLSALAEEFGFTVLNLADVYDNQEESTIIVAEWDKHPNARGHQLIAERLYRALQETGAIPFGASVETQ